MTATLEHTHGERHTHYHEHSTATGEMAEAANKWLDSLSPEQKAKATFHYLDGERQFWYYPPLNRHGLPLRDMDQEQRDLAYGIMESTLDATAYERAKAIMEHELVLGPLEVEAGTAGWDRNPLLYYWTAEVPKGPKQGLRILGHREDLAIELMSGLDEAQRAKAIIHDKAPWDILMYNSSKAAVHEDEGLAGSELSGTQKEILLALITEYVSQVRTEVAKEKLDAILKEGVDNFRLVWAGATDRSRDHYYRIHGGSFIVEFDNIQNGANHIHSVWRDVENDFAQDVLRDHRLMYHIL